MNLQRHSLGFLPHQETEHSPLFSGFWLRWSALTIAERVVCANIVLLPVWWYVGIYRFMPALLLLGIVLYEWQRYGEVHFKRPKLSVIALLAFITYRLFGGIFFDLSTGNAINPTASFRFVLFWYGIALLLWYIQSNNIKVRLKVAAWACSVLTVQMLAYWAVGELLLGAGNYSYPPTLFSRLAGNTSGSYEPGEGLSNFLIPYRPQDLSFAGFVRWSFFFIIPENLALAAGYIVLLSLDIKNKLWSLLLLAGGVLLLLLSGTRAGWLAVPIVIMLRYTFSIGKVWGYALPLALIAALSFSTLSIPPVTSSILDVYTERAQEVGKARADSTAVRGKIYEETLRAIPDKLYFGHWVAGPTVLPGFELGRVGTHSFVLGTLLYRHGVVGAVLFASFWMSLFSWLYKTRKGRPLSGYGLLILYTLLSSTMEFGEVIAWMIVLLSAVVRDPASEIQPESRSRDFNPYRHSYEW